MRLMAKPVKSPAAGPAAGPESRTGRRSVGRPPLGPEVLAGRVAAYCARYGVAARDGLPPFPAGQRETPQHREWLKLYKAQQRLERGQAADGDHGRAAGVALERASAAPALGGACELCGKPLGPDRIRLSPPGGCVHGRCAELVRLALEAGPEAVGRLAPLLWPDGKPGAPAGRNPRRE